MNIKTYNNILKISIVLFIFSISTIYTLLLKKIIDSGFTLTIVKSQISILTLILAGAAFIISVIIESYIIISLLRKKSRGEITYNITADKSIPRFYLLLLIVIFSFNVLFLVSRALDINYDITEINDYTGSIPYPVLAQICPEEWDIIRDNLPIKGTVDSGISADCFVFEPTSFLTEKQFSIRQSGNPIQLGNDDSKIYVSYSLDNYELISEKNADRLFDELWEEFIKNDTQIINVKGWEKAFHYSYEDDLWLNNQRIENDLNGGEGLILKDDNRVMQVSYSGSSTLLNSLDVFQK